MSSVLKRSIHPIDTKQLAILRARLQTLLDIYVRHRPHVQRVLTAGFVAYCLGTTWLSLTGRGARGGTRERGAAKGKGKGKGKGQGDGTEGENTSPLPLPLTLFLPLPLIRDTVLSTDCCRTRKQEATLPIRPSLLCQTETPITHRHPLITITRGSDASATFWVSATEDGIESIRRGPGWEVGTYLTSAKQSFASLSIPTLALSNCFRLGIGRSSLTRWRIVSSLVTAQPSLFLRNLVKWLAVAIPATYTNSMLEYLQSELGLAYRTR